MRSKKRENFNRGVNREVAKIPKKIDGSRNGLSMHAVASAPLEATRHYAAEEDKNDAIFCHL
jgi:hypothetical protein